MLNFGVNKGKTKRFKPRTAIFLLSLVLTLSLISGVFAFTFDNVKDYDTSTKTFTVNDCAVWAVTCLIKGDKIMEWKLTTPDPNPVIRSASTDPKDWRPVACYENQYLDYKENLGTIFTDQEFYNLKSGPISEETKFNRPYEWRVAYLTPYEEMTYKKECSEPTILKNGSVVDNCYTVEDKLLTKYKKQYKTINDLSDIRLNDEVCLFTYVAPNENGEQIPEFAGEKIEENSEWTEALNNGLIAYYSFDDADDSTTKLVEQVYGLYNLTANSGTVIAPSVVNNGAKFLDDNVGYGNNIFTLTKGDFSTNEVTVCFWANLTSLAVDEIGVYIKDTDSNDLIQMWYDSGGGQDWTFSQTGGNAQYNTAASTNTPYLFCGMVDGSASNASLHLNGDTKAVGTAGDVDQITGANVNMRIGWYDGASEWIGWIDEIGIWNRTLSPTEMLQLYNGGSGITYTASGDTTPPYFTGISDVTQYNNTNFVQDINATDGSAFDCFAVDDNVNFSINCSGWIENITTLGVGEHLLNITINDTSNNLNSSILNLTVLGYVPDLTAPLIGNSVNLTNLTTFSLPVNSYWNYTASDAVALDSCYYNSTDNATLTFITCNTATITTPWNSEGYKTIYYYANDTSGNENYTSTDIFINYATQSAIYSDSVNEQTNFTLVMNLSATAIYSFNGTLIWNNTVYYPTVFYNSTYANLTTIITAPSIDTSVIKNFSWNYTLNSVNYITQIYNNTIAAEAPINVSLGSCSGGLFAPRCYDFAYEINGTNVSADVEYNFQYGLVNTTSNRIFGSVTNANSICICVNITTYNNSQLGYGEIQYSKTGFSDRRHYTFSSDTLTDVNHNTTLYLLESGSSTSFLFTIQQGDLSVYDDVYLTLNRWYPDLDEYKIVEMSRTDDEGQTVMKVEIEDVDYRVGVYYTNGTLIYLAAPFRLVCISSPCTYSLIVPEDAGNSLTNWNNLQASITYNATTHIFTAVYNDPSQATDTVNLSVYRDTGLSELLICTDSASSYTAVLTCNVTGYSGMLRAVVFREASPLTYIISKIVNVGSAALGKMPSLFITFIVMVLVVSVGITSPILAVILSILGFIPALIFGAVPLSIMLLIAAMGFIVINFMKRSVQ